MRTGALEFERKTKDMLEEIDKLTLQLYNESERRFTPRFPLIFVMELARAQEYGSIVLVEGKVQNKPVLEGIVLATWEPRVIHKKIGSEDVAIYMESELNVGDHVMFPHWCGVPAPGFSYRYRLVEEDFNKSEYGGILGVVEYEQKPQAEMLSEFLALTEGEEFDSFIDKFLDRFVLIDKNAHSVTLSGK